MNTEPPSQQPLFDNEPSFRPEPFYNPASDSIVFQLVDEAVILEPIDGRVTLFRSAIDHRPIGFQISGIYGLLNTFGWEALGVSSESSEGEVRNISIAAVLLAAYEDGPRTIARRRAYAAAIKITPLKDEISQHELAPSS